MEIENQNQSVSIGVVILIILSLILTGLHGLISIIFSTADGPMPFKSKKNLICLDCHVNSCCELLSKRLLILISLINCNYWSNEFDYLKEKDSVA